MEVAILKKGENLPDRQDHLQVMTSQWSHKLDLGATHKSLTRDVLGIRSNWDFTLHSGGTS